MKGFLTNKRLLQEQESDVLQEQESDVLPEQESDVLQDSGLSSLGMSLRYLDAETTADGLSLGNYR